MQMSTCMTRSYLFRFGAQLPSTLYKLATENLLQKSFQFNIFLYCLTAVNIKWQVCKEVVTAVSFISFFPIMHSVVYTKSKTL